MRGESHPVALAWSVLLAIRTVATTDGLGKVHRTLGPEVSQVSLLHPCKAQKQELSGLFVTSADCYS